jgi:hypothetical protein
LAARLITKVLFLPALAVNQGDPQVWKAVTNFLMSPIEMLNKNRSELLIPRLKDEI